METVTLKGPIVILPAEEYQNLQERLARLEGAVGTLARLVQELETLEDLRVMREAEADYLAGDTADFAELLAEVQADAT